jgi:osmoprotectant transport system permease protein
VAENGFCPGWIADNFDRYLGPLGEHVFLTVVSVGIGFAIALVLGAPRPPPPLAHRADHHEHRDPLRDPLRGGLLPAAAHHRPGQPDGDRRARLLHAADHLPQHHRRAAQRARPEIVDAARGQGLTDRQILRRVELPLAVPGDLAGLRIAFSTTVGLATLAVFAGGGGLGSEILTDRFFKSNVVVAGGLAVALAAAFDIVLLAIQRAVTPWQRALPS